MLGPSRRTRSYPTRLAHAVGTLLCGFILGSALTSSLVARSLQSQAAIPEQLLSMDAGERSNALAAVMRIGVAQASREVRAALIRALQQEAMLHRQRDVAERQPRRGGVHR